MNDDQFSMVFISRMSVEEALLASWPKSNLLPNYKLRSIRTDSLEMKTFVYFKLSVRY